MSPLQHKLWRDLGRSRAQFIAITVTIFLGVTIFGATYDSYQNLRASYDATATEFHFANLTANGGDVETFAQAAVATDGVESVELRSTADIPLHVGDMKLLGRIVGIPSNSTVNQLRVLEGGLPTEDNEIVLEQHMADHFGLTPGSTIQVHRNDRWSDVVVTGVVASPEYIWPSRDRQEILTSPDNFGVAFASQKLAATFTDGVPNEATVYYSGGADDEALTVSLSELARSLGATNVYTRAEQASNAALDEDLAAFEEMAVFFPIMFLAAAAMAAYVMISRLVQAQRPHIGGMLANGLTRTQVLWHYLGYGLIPGLLGAIPGAVVGVLLARLITGLYTSMLAIPVTLISFYPLTLLGAIAFGLVASLVAALAPALVASRVAPAEAMRGETPAGGGRRSIIERIIPPLAHARVGWRMAIRGIGRNRRRTIYTITGVVLSLMLVLVSWGMIDTVNSLLDRQFVQIEKEDATVHFAGTATTDDVGALTAVDGVAAAEPVLTVPVSVASGDAHYDTALTVLADDTVMHRLVTPDGEWIPLPADGVVLGKSTRDLLDIELGDPVTLSVTGLDTVDASVVAFVDEPLGTMAYMARSEAESLTGVPLPVTSAMVTYDLGVDAAALRSAITETPNVAAFEDTKALYSTMQDYMVLFYAFVGVMLLFGGAMAFALIFSSMSVNIAERTREVATLLAVGTDRRTISRYITAENLIVALLGIPLGLVVGYLAAWEAMGSFSSDLFSFELSIRPMTFVWAAGAILVVGLVSQWPGLRAIRRISVAEVVKERSA
ncbi:MAG: ABC transporter permease [Acidimicrobiia bacterium]